MAMYGRMFSAGRNEDYDRGLRLFDQGLYEPAILELEKVMESSNQVLVRLSNFYLAECWSYLASYAMGQRLFERAAECFEAALIRNPSYADLHCKLSAVYYLQGKIKEADHELGIALSINPEYVRALVQMAVCKYRLGSPGAGFELLNRAVELDAGVANDYYHLGKASHLEGDFSAALSHFSMVIASDIDDVAYHARLGSDFFRRGLLDEASEAFEKALRINPDYADLHNSLGMTYLSAGRYLLAIAEFKKALEINPAYEDARINCELATTAAQDSGVTFVNLELVDDNSEEERSTGN